MTNLNGERNAPIACTAAAKTLRVSFLYRIFLDTFLLVTLLSLAHKIQLFWQTSTPERRTLGFFCGDASLSYPWHPDSVSAKALYRLSLQLPLLLIVVVEAIWHRQQQTQLEKSTPPQQKRNFLHFLLQLHQPVSCFLFGYAAEHLIMVITKHFFPRLRPHFFAVCVPQVGSGDACEEPLSHTLQPRFIDSYVCSESVALQYAASSHHLRGVDTSFPSGHASLCFYGMLYVVLYLQRRCRWRRTQLLRPLLQLLCVLVAWCVALTRIWDHMHHASDVVVGAALGTLCALAAFKLATAQNDSVAEPWEKLVNERNSGGSSSAASGSGTRSSSTASGSTDDDGRRILTAEKGKWLHEGSGELTSNDVLLEVHEIRSHTRR